ncbi:MAG: ribonuclease HII [Patescibacteria group bacterium]|nr:ribonuclease HII [Patescibacteria group bacterium]
MEKQIFRDGYEVAAGIDEAGRGALAGPVAAAVAAIRKDALGKISFGKMDKFVTDSKRLSEKKREEIFEEISKNPNIEWKVSFIHSAIIDKVNIWQATLAAWRGCLKKLDCQPNFLFLDGSFYLDGSFCRNSKQISDNELTQTAIIGADRKIFLVSLASIIAKVTRDRLMRRMHQKYPQYGFIRHKGYGTKLHLEKLKKFGPCPIHRKSFKPIRNNI